MQFYALNFGKYPIFVVKIIMKEPEGIENYKGQPLTRQVLLHMLKGYKRPYDKIEELVKQGALLPVKKGLFVPGPALKIPPPESFLLANHIKGPSYVSLESALSFWRLIPELVYEITSVTTGRSKVYDTKVGRFSYIHLSTPYYAFGQRAVDLGPGQVALIAIPEKALCDTIVTTAGVRFRSPAAVKEWMIEDRRMDREGLRRLQTARMQSWLKKAPKKQSLEFLVKALEDL